ncbi:MAG: archease [Candidatus Calescibacterium sp.]|jgi:SHS2 domain-containing protein|nr:archease [Candidatus Calescibacterium sp.]
MFEIMDHTGEAGFTVKAKTKEEIIRDSIDALYYIYFGEDKFEEKKKREESEGIEEIENNIIEGNIIEKIGDKKNKGVGKKIRLKIKSDGIDFVDALITLLNEIIFLFDTKKIAPFKLEKVKIIEDKEKAEIEVEMLFESLKENNLNPKIYIKAVTYGGAELKKEGEYFLLPIIVDI